jgi:macrolide-specific efflux system membrane fusion protein
VTIDALPGTKLAAHVIAIDTTSTVVSNVVTYTVTFAFDNPEPSGVKPGMTAEVDVTVAEADNVVNVTSSAVTGTGANGRVTVLVGKQQTTRPVVVGLRGDSSTQIVAGLKAETVVLPTLNISSSSNRARPSSTSTLAGGGGFGAAGSAAAAPVFGGG